MRKLLIIIALLLPLFAFVEIDESAPQILPAEQAFKPMVYLKDDKVVVDIELADKIYIYKKDIKLTQIKPIKKEVILALPKPMILHGDEVYEKRLLATAPLSSLDPGKVEVELSFQGCSEVGICYPPQKKIFSLNVPKQTKPSAVTMAESVKSDEELIVSILKNRSIWVVLGSFFLSGLLLALTPCVFPMIPILSSLIVGAKDMNTKKAFVYSLVYVLAMASTYTIAGVLAGLFGSNLQAAFQNPVIIVLFALVFVALAMSMFGFYEIGLPASIQTKLAQKSEEAGKKGGLVGVAVMGFFSALIVGPCVAPPLAGALIYIGQTGDALLGGAALFVMSLGMGVPLLLVGIGAGKFMPKPGGWMTAVNKVFGVVMLGVAIWMLGRILPSAVELLLWALLFIGSAVYLRAFEGISHDAHWFAYFKKFVGIVLFVYGLFLFFGSFTGASNPIDPLKVLKTGGLAQSEKEEIFQEIEDLKELQKVLQNAKKPVLVDVTAKWCTSCRELEEFTFSDKRVQEKLKEFAAYKLDVTDNSKSDKEFMKHYGIFGPPAILIFKDGTLVRKITGFKNAEEFLKILEEV